MIRFLSLRRQARGNALLYKKGKNWNACFPLFLVKFRLLLCDRCSTFFVWTTARLQGRSTGWTLENVFPLVSRALLNKEITHKEKWRNELCLYFRVFFYQRFVSLKQFQYIFSSNSVTRMLKSSFVSFSPIRIQHFSSGGGLLLQY